MNLINPTKNQHFLSQIEQRLNTSTPNAKTENQSIYEFNVLDPDQGIISAPIERKIVKNLSSTDLFSFDIKNNVRSNFEALFHQYETDIATHTKSLLHKIDTNNSDLSIEIIGIFSAKLMNTFRNPYCVEKTINTLSNLINYVPTDPELKNIHNLVENGNKSHQDFICREFKISTVAYQKWLTVLYMLLVPHKPINSNLFEDLIKEIYEKDTNFLSTMIYTYKTQSPVISDRSFVSYHTNEFLYAFNLTGNALITYAFVDIEKNKLFLNRKVTAGMLALYKQERNRIDVKIFSDNIPILESYNKNAVFQAHSRVFCKSPAIYGLTIKE